MAHSTAAMAMTSEVNYFYQDKNGKILKVLKPADIKQESPIVSVGRSAAVYSAPSSATMGAYSQMTTSNQAEYIRIPNNYNVHAENTTYAVIASQSSTGDSNMQELETGSIYETPLSPAVHRYKERFTKYTQNSNMKTKLKLTNSTNASVQKKRKPEKAGKGLRHFSMKVCEKVKEKGKTTYNEVADELVAEEILERDSANCDQKNIRRRVYDALNVLMAMQIISKDKKEIRWIGLPNSSAEECSAVEKENEERRERIKQKHQQIRELLLQQVAFKSLIKRNRDAERQGSIPTPNSSIQLPFIIVNTHKSTKINCSVTNDKSEYIFKFDDKFEMHDDAEVLKRMGLNFGLDKGQCSADDIQRAKDLVPPNFAKYIEAYGNGKGDTSYDSDDDDMPAYIELPNESQDYTRKSPDLDEDDDDEEFSPTGSDVD